MYRTKMTNPQSGTISNCSSMEDIESSRIVAKSASTILKGSESDTNIVTPPPTKVQKSNNYRSHSSSSSSRSSSNSSSRSIPGIFVLMERGEWDHVIQRARRYPKEVKRWVKLYIKNKHPSSSSSVSAGNHHQNKSYVKCKALHHACYILRNVPAQMNHNNDGAVEQDIWRQACLAIQTLIEIHPEACSERETRHGCLPLHLAVFSMGSGGVSSLHSYYPSRPYNVVASNSSSISTIVDVDAVDIDNDNDDDDDDAAPSIPPCPTAFSGRNTNNHRTVVSFTTNNNNNKGCEDTNDEQQRHRRQVSSLSSLSLKRPPSIQVRDESCSSRTTSSSSGSSYCMASTSWDEQQQEQREEWSVQLLNQLLDAYPKSIRTDSEGGRLPLHTAIAGNATPRIIEVLLRAYSDAARHRSDSQLPLHLVAHWGVSHLRVATMVLRAYPEAVHGRNKWERTPMEEALYMAGENGRPHQMRLLHCLRKKQSSSYYGTWTPPPIQYPTSPLPPTFSSNHPNRSYHQNHHRKKPLHLVDVDETIDGDETTVASPPPNQNIATSHNIHQMAVVESSPRSSSSPEETAANNNNPIDSPISSSSSSSSFLKSPNRRKSLFKTSSYCFRKKAVIENDRLQQTPPSTTPVSEANNNNNKHKRKNNIVTPTRNNSSRTNISTTSFNHNNMNRDVPSLSSLSLKNRRVLSSSAEYPSELASMIRSQSWTTILQQSYFPFEISTIIRSYYKAKVTTLYLICEHNPPLFILQHVLQTLQQQQANHHAMNEGNSSISLWNRTEPGGRSPLHAACTWGASLEVIQFLVQQHPKSLTLKDEYGNLPLHCACFAGVSTDVLKFLVRLYPPSLLLPNTLGSKPLNIVQRLRHHRHHATNLQYLKQQIIIQQQHLKLTSHSKSTVNQSSPSSQTQQQLQEDDKGKETNQEERPTNEEMIWV